MPQVKVSLEFVSLGTFCWHCTAAFSLCPHWCSSLTNCTLVSTHQKDICHIELGHSLLLISKQNLFT